MHKKMANLRRYLRAPILLTSVAVLVVGCASKNPLLDDEDSSEILEQTTVRQETPLPQKEKATTPDLTETKIAKPRSVETKAQKEETISEIENELNTKPSGMKKWLSKLSPYKVNLQQGNFISSEMLAKIRQGMTREQVRFVLGTPLLVDMFHANRWDYFFRLQKPNGSTTTYRVTVFFKDSLVDHINHDALPEEAEYLSSITSDDEPSEKIKKKTEKPTENQVSSDTSKTTTSWEPESPTQSATQTESASESESQPITAPEPVSIPEPISETALERAQEPIDTVKPSADITRSPKPVSTPVPVRTPTTVRQSESDRKPEPAKTSEPVDTSTSVRTPEPVNIPEPVNAPVPETVTNTVKRPEKQDSTHKNQQVYAEDGENDSSENISAFEPISTPSRIGRMRPSSPNDELIGNIQ